MPQKSESELRTRIDELSLDIDAQKQILRDLENERSKARFELNSIRDPLAGLAVELAAQIFLHCLPIYAPPRPDPRVAPMVLLSVCHLWRNIAVSTPELWTQIHIDWLTTEFDSAQCKIWLGRTLALPLSFTFRGPLAQGVGTLVKQYGHRLKNLALVVQGNSKDLTRIESQGPFPALTTLTIAAHPTKTNSCESLFQVPESVELLRAAPRLVECDFDEVFYAESHYHLGVHPKPVTHTSLQHLRLGQPHSRALHDTHRNGAFILRCLTLPALKSLDIANFDIRSSDFIDFLTRSSPPLESLRMIPSTTLVEHFRFMPSLTELELWRYNCEEEDKNDGYLPPFLQALGTVLDFLPNLRDLTIRGFFPHDYRALIVALRRRHGQLQSFQLIFPSYYDDLEPVEDGAAIPALRKLAADGMRIHIGPKDRNFV
ncbi:hypothetical protein DFH06DRAFT_769854 [Mycena polygramma]|nr:hypothetical protein DFH06DRAFT_769854 [Mycena polygramma]